MIPFFSYNWCRRCKDSDPESSSDALYLEDVTVVYPGHERAALQGIDLSVPCGHQVALVGPNGAGKSTLLKVIAGLIPLTSGILRVHGNPLGACHHRVAYLPQRSEINWHFPVTVRRFVMAGRFVHLGWFRWPRSSDHEIVSEVLRQLGIEFLSGRQIGELSGGQQQRILLARALAQGADLLLFDEPLNAVDLETCEVIQQIMKDLRTQGKTVLAATHNLERLSDEFDDAVCLEQGQQLTSETSIITKGPKSEALWTGLSNR
ncbi:MAG: metal ABC transporter ATP-binding protein [Gemmataceae bacterium]